MKKNLLYVCYILLGILFTSCIEEELLPCEGPQAMKVYLHLSFPEVEDLSTRAQTGDLDPTTEEQQTISEDDLFVLVFQDGRLINQVKDLRMNQMTTKSGIAILEGSFPSPKNTELPVKLIVLANLTQNQLSDVPSNPTLASVQQYLDGLISLQEQDVYKRIVYNYSVGTHGTFTTPLWNASERRIPMWGTTANLSLQAGNKLNAGACELHRAIAKLGFTVNEGLGYNGFWIESIAISRVRTQGYVAPLELTHLQGDYFSQPFIPLFKASWTGQLEFQDFQYVPSSGENKEILNKIYLPETTNTTDKMFIRIIYHKNNSVDSKYVDVEVTEPIIRNHSYIFNLQKKDPVGVTITYRVMEWTSLKQNLIFGNADGDITKTNLK